MAKGLKDTIEEIQKDMGKRIYETCLRGNLPENDSLLTKNDIVRLKRCIFAQGATNLPPITTHNVVRNKCAEICRWDIHLFEFTIGYKIMGLKILDKTVEL